jgi:hypothetical protein
MRKLKTYKEKVGTYLVWKSGDKGIANKAHYIGTLGAR